MGENKQTMTVLIDTTIRGIVDAVNELGIKKSDIVSFFKDSGSFVLVYYK